MSESSSSPQKKATTAKSVDAIITAINMAAMGAGIAAAVAAAGKSKTTSAEAARIEKSVSELNAKFDRISEQLKSIQQPAAKMEMPANAKESAEKKPESAQQPQQQQKPQDVIYVRKSSEFSFYN